MAGMAVATVWADSRLNRVEARVTALESSQSETQVALRRADEQAPGLGEVMSGVQVHFAKLYYAGRTGNKGLTQFELDELEENLEKVPAIRPTENGFSLAVGARALKDGLARIRAASAKGDPSEFDQAYQGTMQACNACHMATGHGYIVITAPLAPPVPNQSWAGK